MGRDKAMLHTELRLAVASDQALVAEAVRAAMASRGFDAVTVPWPGPVRVGMVPPGDATVPDVGLIMCDLVPYRRLGEVQALVVQVRAPVLLLTSAPRGPLWGAVLESGVSAVLSSATTLDEAVTALHELAGGAVLMSDRARRELGAEWSALSVEKELLSQRIQSLTPRERTVLRLLFAGDSVRMIAEILGVAETTVRTHVRAVLRKMEVNSQLAAVSAFAGLRDEGPDVWTWTG